MVKIKQASLAVLLFALFSCGGGKTDTIPTASTTTTTTTPEVAPEATVVKTDAATYDPKRGLGKHENIDVSKFDPAMAAEGKKIAEVKCTSCHKPTDEKLVGPGWKGITNRQTAGWIMNFITNPDPMIEVDPEVKKQLELCLVRMPNQSLTDVQARDIVEYMREIDGAK